MVSEAISTSLLADAIYDILKHTLMITGANLKDRLRGWLIDESTLTALESQLVDLELNRDMNQSAIETRLLASDDLLEIIRHIRPDESTTIIQTHSGTGDNVAGNKIINR